MPSPTLPSGEPALLPTELQRRQIFHWLKRVSSVTAWRRILDYYRQWASVTEACARVAVENGWEDDTSLPPAEHALVLRCLAHCQAGVDGLAQGDKRVFKFDRHGQFAMAVRMLSHWTQMLERIRIGENTIRKKTPMWPEFCDAVMSLAMAWGECGQFVLEPRYLEDAAHLSYSEWLENYLNDMPFPEVLPDVPDPVDSPLVRTGRMVPCSGIWEPVDAPAPSLLGWLTRTPTPRPPFKATGTMNYLHGGSHAPPVTLQSATDSADVAVTWRLLWADERYLDGTVPAEEAEYRFARPDAVLPPPPAVSVSFDPDPVRADSGLPASQAGVQ